MSEHYPPTDLAEKMPHQLQVRMAKLVLAGWVFTPIRQTPLSDYITIAKWRADYRPSETTSEGYDGRVPEYKHTWLSQLIKMMAEVDV